MYALGKFDLNGDIVVDYDNRTLTNTNNANGNLTPNEIDIIVSYMIVEWIAPLKNSEEILKSNLSSQEYNRVAQTNMLDKLKPRKIINRLPDLAMWLVCEDGKVEEAPTE